MTRDPLTELSTRATPQSRPARADQVQNDAGGYTFAVDEWTRLNRFLTLGVTGGSFYVKARELAIDNLTVLRPLITREPIEIVKRVVELSESGRAPRQQPGLFVLAAVAGLAGVEGRRAAAEAVPRVARTGSTLKTFVQYAQQFRGWGPVLRRGVANWYLNQPVDRLAYQAVKYRQRVDWTDRDVLRLAHPKAAKDDLSRRALFDWICRGTANFASDEELDARTLPIDDPLRIVEGFERIRRARSANEAARLVGEYRLPWETVPDEWLNNVNVLAALVDSGMPITALLRQLPRLTRAGLLPNSGGRTNEVVHTLTNAEHLRRGRVHPISLLLALTTYQSGRSVRGSSTWQPTRRIVDALDTGFYAAFESVEATGLRHMLALDVSGSMTNYKIADTHLTAREASAAMALVTLQAERDCEVVGFTAGQLSGRFDGWHSRSITPLDISPRQRLDDVVRYTRQLSFGATDCALPMLYAIEKNLDVDVFVIYTDNETWTGDVHVHEALRRYRDRSGIPARLVAVGMTATNYTVADPNDAGQLNVSGFDAAVPNLIASFARREV
jgi:60 kDa SS-A/Ro ribonucleoprotein